MFSDDEVKRIKQIKDCNQILLMFKFEHGLDNPSFQQLKKVSPIENESLFAARCRSILKNGRPVQATDMIVDFDEWV